MSLRLAYLKENGYVAGDGDLRHTKVTNFCLPMYGLHKRDFKGKLLNVYILHEVTPHLYVVTLKDDIIDDILSKLSEHDDFVESFDDDDGKELIFKLRVPKRHEEDYYKILNGVYSEISDEYKEILKYFYTNSVYPIDTTPLIVNGQVATTMWEILNPSVRKREQVAKHFGVEVDAIKQLMSKPDLKYELYIKANQLYNQENQL